MTLLRPLFFAALLAGLLAGAAGTVLHQFGTVPLILQAETYEMAPAAGQVHAHGNEATLHHHAAAWQPEDGLERTAYTGLADLLTGTAYGFLLVGAFALRGKAVDWRQGLFWGLAGFAVFTLAPGLGLPPELPGTEAAPLAARQIWWVATVLLTAGGLGLLAFSRHLAWVALGAGLIVLPHLIGAPQPAEHAALAPEALAQRFIVMVTLTSLLFWLVLGGAAGWLYGRFSRA
ncbi:CbtA family protein [Roseomonas sp. E05]|uniref:CbtA family protein n=1 Tax=Roseomonas sp. E05 TaxID=3046310 RepID=UPI0024B8F4C7|nr:CbtA family protein [Roseomonas sp. E05]MDJ0391493.1 CbtA family protein [Roseomonas sp. E05]